LFVRVISDLKYATKASRRLNSGGRSRTARGNNKRKLNEANAPGWFNWPSMFPIILKMKRIGSMGKRQTIRATTGRPKMPG
jgi:hypothetical protein